MTTSDPALHSRTPAPSCSPLRFAHAFFTNAPPHEPATDVRGHRRMAEHVQGLMESISELAEDPVLTLADVVGANRAGQIEATGAVQLHATGDNGTGMFPSRVQNGADDELQFGGSDTRVVDVQEEVARAMNRDLNPSLPGWSPAFPFHLRDVVYFDNPPVGFWDAEVSYSELGLAQFDFWEISNGQLRPSAHEWARGCDFVAAYGVVYPQEDRMHEIHMNPGESSGSGHVNRTNQDGALAFYFRNPGSEPPRRWVFTKFSTQHLA